MDEIADGSTLKSADNRSDLDHDDDSESENGFSAHETDASMSAIVTDETVPVSRTYSKGEDNLGVEMEGRHDSYDSLAADDIVCADNADDSADEIVSPAGKSLGHNDHSVPLPKRSTDKYQDQSAIEEERRRDIDSCKSSDDFVPISEIAREAVETTKPAEDLDWKESTSVADNQSEPEFGDFDDGGSQFGQFDDGLEDSTNSYTEKLSDEDGNEKEMSQLIAPLSEEELIAAIDRDFSKLKQGEASKNSRKLSFDLEKASEILESKAFGRDAEFKEEESDRCIHCQALTHFSERCLICGYPIQISPRIVKVSTEAISALDDFHNKIEFQVAKKRTPWVNIFQQEYNQYAANRLLGKRVQKTGSKIEN